MPINMLIHLIQKPHMIIELVSNLDTELSLPPDRCAERIELLVLLVHDGSVVSEQLWII